MIRRFTENVVGLASAAFDRAVTRAVQVATDGKQADPELNREQRIAALEAMLERYAGLDPRGYHLSPVALEPTQRRVGELAPGLAMVDFSWPSAYQPFLSELGERYHRTKQNGVALLRLFARERPRPLALIVHGYMTGKFSFEQRIWPLPWFDALGLDVALFVLPFHGSRADPLRRGRPEFPGKDPQFANEGFRQAMLDLRSVMRFLRQRGHPAVGLLGMSLGGYTAALAATLEAEIDFLVPIIPLASLADFALEQRSLSPAPEIAAREHALLERIHAPVSPLAAPALLAPERTLVIGARADRITPVSHARRIAAHFGAPLHTWHGGHLLQFGRGEAFTKVGELLRQIGVVG